MKCPVDDTVLVLSERQGVEIDYCPQCRGVWLDRGELDKLIERAPADDDRGRYDDDRDRDRGRYEDDRDRGRYDRDRDRERERHRDDDYRGGKPKKKRSFLSDIFEFGE